MRILVTNDDGFEAPGLEALTRVAAGHGDVVVVAPTVEQSYMGHRVTAHDVLRPVAYAPGRFHLNGTPADCVRIALRGLRLEVDLVLSGINCGGNLGADIYTSGTVAAAREAAFLGKPALALSQYVQAGTPLDWSETAACAGRAVAELLTAGVAEQGVYWNVNLPHPGPAAGMVQCEPDAHPLDVRFAEEDGGFRFAGRYADRPRAEGRDVAQCFAGYITVSRLRL